MIDYSQVAVTEVCQFHDETELYRISPLPEGYQVITADEVTHGLLVTNTTARGGETIIALPAGNYRNIHFGFLEVISDGMGAFVSPRQLIAGDYNPHSAPRHNGISHLSFIE